MIVYHLWDRQATDQAAIPPALGCCYTSWRLWNLSIDQHHAARNESSTTTLDTLRALRMLITDLLVISPLLLLALPRTVTRLATTTTSLQRLLLGLSLLTELTDTPVASETDPLVGELVTAAHHRVLFVDRDEPGANVIHQCLLDPLGKIPLMFVVDEGLVGLKRRCILDSIEVLGEGAGIGVTRCVIVLNIC